MQSIINVKDLVGVKQVAAQTLLATDIDFSGWAWVANGIVTLPPFGTLGPTTGGSGTGMSITSVIVSGTN